MATNKNESVFFGKTVWVTGATGFVGPWAVEALLGKGAEVVALVRDERARSRFFTEGMNRRVNVVHGDVTDFSICRRTIAEYEVDYVLHLASQSIVGAGSADPLSTFSSNIIGTANVLEACRIAGNVSGVMVASSDKVYGCPAKLPCDENAPLCGAAPYDVSKSCMDLLAQSYFARYALPVTISRCANIFGGGDFNLSRLVPGTMVSVLDGKSPVIRSDGNPMRDYLFVEDAVSGMLALLADAQKAEIAGQAFNFSLSEPLSVTEVVTAILKIIGNQKLAPIIQNQAKGETDKLFIDSAKARRLLGWFPQTPMDKGLSLTADWYKEHWNW